MHDIWNPWHGCHKCSEGCKNCYMYYLDKIHNNGDSSIVTRTSNFNYPLSKTRSGIYKVKSGEMLRVCMTSDFFVEEADKWRNEAWDIIYKRRDVIFFLLTKRPERVRECLPKDWGDGWENVFFNVTCENQKRADERLPMLLSLPFKHKGIMAAPLIGEISIAKYLVSGQIEQVMCDGENYEGARPCYYHWAKKLYDECVEADVKFTFISTGNFYIKEGKRISNKSQNAYSEGLWHYGKPINFVLRDSMGLELQESELYKPQFRTTCLSCSGRLTCNGCSSCGKCNNPFVSQEQILDFEKQNKSLKDR